jgi:hypothetical protein
MRHLGTHVRKQTLAVLNAVNTSQVLRAAAFTSVAAAALLLAFASRTKVHAQARAQSSTAPAAAGPSVETLRKDFLNPPDTAKPMVRWWWFGPAVVKPEILRELQQMKADGIQGAELAFVYPEQLDDPAQGINNLTFLSPEMLDDVGYAQTEGKKLGLRIDVTLCSGWPYGGPATTLAEAATNLRTAEVPVPAGATTIAVPTLAAGKSVTDLGRARFMVNGQPALAEGDTILSADIVNSKAVPPPAAGGGRGGRGGPPPLAWDATSAKPLPISGASLTIAPSDTPRVALFFIQSHTGQAVKRAAVGAEGYVLDPYSREAVATHLKAVGEPLVKAFGAATPPYAIFSDSLEAFGADWTPSLPAEFKKRRGYDLLPHLPELVAGGSLAADNVRHDYGVTLTELSNENYLKQIADWAAAHHTKFRSQTYHESAVTFSSQNIPQLAEGEGPQWRAFSTLRWATSANHVFGHDVSSGETFTWLHSPVFRATPLDMKTEADIDFVMGENQLIFHGWPYSPPQAFQPGWSLYAAANFNDNNPWHPVMPAVTKYIARMSYLLRQGQPANQVVILLPTDDTWTSFHPTATSITNEMPRFVTPALMSAILSAGYNVDYIDAEAIDKVGLGAHQILVIPPTNRIPEETIKKIAAFTQAGGKTIVVGHAPTLNPDGKPLTVEMKSTTLVPDEAHLGDALHAAATPDFKLASDSFKDQIGFIRRKLPTADVYFVANTSNQPLDITASFATKHKFAEAWDPDSAASTPASATGQAIHLEPYESRVFVFSETAPPVDNSTPHTGPTIKLNLETSWKVSFPGIGKSVDEEVLADWTADPATLHYSGEAIYSRDFNVFKALKGYPFTLEITGGAPLPGAPNAPPEKPVLGPNGLPDPAITRPGNGMHAYYDPPIHEGALVYINDQYAGALWHPPYRLDVTPFMLEGANHIEIRVYNTAMNAWSALPPHDFKPLVAKYGDRFQMQDLDKVAPVSSGLLGSIHLVTKELK